MTEWLILAIIKENKATFKPKQNVTQLVKFGEQNIDGVIANSNSKIWKRFEKENQQGEQK